MDFVEEKKTMIQRKCKVFGEIISNDDVVLYGEVKGNITCENDVIAGGVLVGNVEANELHVYGSKENGGKEGSVFGDVRVRNCVTNGKIKGDCFVKEDMLIGNDATVIGEINAGNVEIKKGAAVRGNLNINR